MHPVRTALTRTTNPVVLVAMTWALLWGFGASQVPMTLAAPGSHAQQAAGAARSYGADQVWQESWSERYPGCVALALWPDDEQPVALVTRGSDGGLDRVEPRRAPGAGEVVGACR